MIPINGQADRLEVGVLVRQRRIHYGWTQAQLAERAGIRQGSLSLFEQTGTGLRFDALCQLLAAVGLALYVDDGAGEQTTAAPVEEDEEVAHG